MRSPSRRSLACLLLLGAATWTAPAAAQSGSGPKPLQPKDVAELIVAGYGPEAFWSNFQQLPRAFPVNDSSIALIRRLVRKQGGRWPADSIGMVRVLARLRPAVPRRTIAAKSAPAVSTRGLPSQPGEVAAVAFREDSVTLDALGASARVSAELRNRFDRPIPGLRPEWRSTDPAIVDVDGDGVVRAESPGEALVVAEAAGYADTAIVVVRQVPATISLDESDVTLAAVGHTRRVTAAVADANGYAIDGARVAWASSDPESVAVDSTGELRAVGPGEAEIRVRSGEVEASLRASVPRYNVLVAVADGYEATLVSNDLPASPRPDVTSPVSVFRLSCARCQRFNVRLDPFRVGWAAGRYCRRGRVGPVPIAVKGRSGPAVVVRACCPEDAPCAESAREDGGWSAGTAHFLVAVRADGSVTSTVEEYLEVCPEERGRLEGAIDYPPRVLDELSWPSLDADDLTSDRPGSAARPPEPDTRRSRPSTP